MKSLLFSFVLLLLVIVGGGVWGWLTSIGAFKPEPVVEIEVTGGTNGTLKVVTDYDYWPYSFIDKNGKISGREIEGVYNLANMLGMNIDLKALRWEECINAAMAHEVDLVLTRAECSNGRERQALIYSTPIESDHYEVFGKEKIS